MSIEAYQPSKEEIKHAEENLNPKQRVQSEAHEEGYKVGLEQNKDVLYFELEDSTLEKLIEKKLSFDINYDSTNKFKMRLNELCLHNDVECNMHDNGRGSYLAHKIDVILKGSKEDILLVFEGLKGYY